MRETVILGVCGGSGSGKTTFSRHLANRIGAERISVLPLDAYYKDLGDLTFDERLRVNFDHPDAIDISLFAEHLDALRSGDPVRVPVYDFAAHTRSSETVMLEPKQVVLVEGILVLHFSEIMTRLDRSIFLDVPAPVRRDRRVSRDVVERGRLADEVGRVFDEVVQPMHDTFVEPGRVTADHVVNFESDPDDVIVRLLADIDDPALVAV